MASVTIDVLYRFKKAGDDLVSNLKQEFNAIKMDDTNISEGIKALENAIREIPDKIDETVKNTFENIEGYLDDIKEGITGKADGIFDIVGKLIDNKMADVTDLVGSKTNVMADKVKTQFLEPVEAGFTRLIVRTSLAASALMGAPILTYLFKIEYDKQLSYLTRLRDAQIDLFKEAGKKITREMFQIDAVDIYFRTVKKIVFALFNLIRNQLKTTFDLFKGVIGQFGSTVLLFVQDANLKNFFKVLSGSFSFFGVFYIYKLAKEGFGVLKQIISGSYEVLTPIEQASRFITVITNGLFHVHSTIRNIHNTAKSIAVGIFAYVMGSTSMWFSLVGSSFKTMMTWISPSIQRLTGKYLGSAKAQIVSLLDFVRTTLFNISSTLRPQVNDYIKSVAKIGESITRIQAGVKGGDKSVLPTLDFLKTSKLPMSIQLQSIRLELSNMAKLATEKIVYLASLVESSLSGIKPDVALLKEDALNAVKMVDFSTKKVFIDIEKYGIGWWAKFKGLFSRDLPSISDMLKTALVSPFSLVFSTGKKFVSFISGFFKNEVPKTATSKSSPAIASPAVPVPMPIAPVIALTAAQKNLEAAMNASSLAAIRFIKVAASVAFVLGVTSVKTQAQIEQQNQLTVSMPRVVAVFDTFQKKINLILLHLRQINSAFSDVLKFSMQFDALKLTTPLFSRQEKGVFIKLVNDLNALYKLIMTKNDLISKSVGGVNDVIFYKVASLDNKINTTISKIVTNTIKAANSFGLSVDPTFVNLMTRLNNYTVFTHKMGQDLPNVIAKITALNKEINKQFSAMGLEYRMLSSDPGRKFVTLLVTGVQRGQPEIDKVFSAFVDAIMEFFPQSPAKRGALKGLQNSGRKILDELGKGITSGIPTLKILIARLTETIARFFPRSPAEEGALKNLRQMGAKILDELTYGITSKIASIKNLFMTLAKMIQTSLYPLLELGLQAERVGLKTDSLLRFSHAFASFGINVGDLNMAFTSMNKSLNDAVTTENLSSFAQLGLSLEKARKSTDPLLEMMLQLSDILSRYPIESKEVQKAFELFGITANTNLVNVLKQGRGEIVKLMKEGGKFGATFDESFIKLGHHFNSFLVRLEKMDEYLEYQFLATILPKVNELMEKLFKFYDDNIIYIRATVKILGNVFTEVLAMVQKLTTQAINKPQEALEFLVGLVLVTFRSIENSLWTLWDDLWTGLLSKAAKIVVGGAVLAIKSVWRYISEFGTELLKYVASLVPKVIKAVMSPLTKFLKPEMKMSFRVLGYGKIIDAIEGIEKGTDSLITNTESSFEMALYRSVDLVNKDLENFKNTVKTNFKEAIDDKTIKETTDRFRQLMKDISSSFKGATNNSEFGKTMSESITNIEKLISSKNFVAVSQEIEKVQDKLNKAFIDAEKGTKKVVNSVVKSTKQGTQELYQLIKKHNEMILDMNVRIAGSEFDTMRANHEKAQVELLKKQEEELAVYEGLLAAKMELNGNFTELVNEREEFIRKQSLEREKLMAAQKLEVWTKTLENLQTMTSTMSSMFNDLYELSKKQVKEFFYVSKAAALAEAIINTANGVTKALAQGGAWGIAQGAMVAAAGTVQVAKIMAETLGFNKGGIVPGSGNKDTVPAMLTPKEFVQPEGAVSYYGADIMEGLRRKLIPREAFTNMRGSLPNPIRMPKTAYKDGGLVVPNRPVSNEIRMTSINVNDPKQLENTLQSTRGKNVLLNMMSNNAVEFRKAMST